MGKVDVPIVGCVGVPIVGGIDVPIDGTVEVPIVDIDELPIVDDETMLGKRKPSVENASNAGKVDALRPAVEAPKPAVDDSGAIPGVVVRLRRGSVDALVPGAGVV